MPTPYGLMYAMAGEAKLLTNCSKRMLKSMYPKVKFARHWSKGEMIEKILIAKFSETAREMDPEDRLEKLELIEQACWDDRVDINMGWIKFLNTDGNPFACYAHNPKPQAKNTDLDSK